MLDQAHKLRTLIEVAPAVAGPCAPGPPMIVVAGGKAGVGSTTVAVNLGAVLADLGERVVVVDATQHDSNLADVAGASPAIIHTVADVLSGACPAAEALAPGPAGTLLLANRGRGQAASDFSRHVQQRFLSALQSLHDDASVLVVDVGSGLTPWTRRFWLRAETVVLVTTTDDMTLLDAYAAIKRTNADDIRADVRVLANRCDSEAAARDVYGRVSAACERFLSRRVQSLPALPEHVAASRAGGAKFPRVWEAPNSPFGHAALWLGRAVGDVLADRMRDAGVRGQGCRDRCTSERPAAGIRRKISTQ